MTSFSEDKIFKNINDEDARILLDIIDVTSIKVKIWTKELRLFDPKDFVPDIILELDSENLILELQSTRVDEEFSKRGLTYVAIANRHKDNDKQMNLIVLSTVEKSKTIEYRFNEKSVFTYRIVNLKDLDANEIMNTVEPKIRKGLKIEAKELILYALIPMIIGKDMEKYIKRIVDNLLQVSNATDSVKNLSYGIEWLIVDKFIIDKEFRQILCDKLSDRMSLIYEYGDRREEKGRTEGRNEGRTEGRNEGRTEGRNEGMKEILKSLIESGDSLSELSKKTGKTIKELKKILND